MYDLQEFYQPRQNKCLDIQSGEALSFFLKTLEELFVENSADPDPDYMLIYQQVINLSILIRGELLKVYNCLSHQTNRLTTAHSSPPCRNR